GGAGRAEALHWTHVAPFILLNLVLAAGAFAVFSVPARRERVTAALSALRWRGRLAGRGPLERAFWFDDLYAAVVVLPLKVLAWTLRLIAENVFVGVPLALGAAGRGLARASRRLQTGGVQHYAAGILLFMTVAAWMLLWGRG